MGSKATLSVISTAENALKKLKKAGICAYGCKKDGAKFIFSVKDKQLEKVFAIFSKPCYNITVIKRSRFSRAVSLCALRAGLIFGAAAFVAVALAANTLVLKIKVSGSGSFLEPEVRRIVLDEGAAEFKPYSAFNKSAATGRILALPQVTFCNISKKGSVLIVDVQVDEQHSAVSSRKPLVSDCNGTVKTIVAVCGTAAVKEGDAVKRGDTLIYAHTLAGEEQIDCLAAGYCVLECRKTSEFFAECESEENLKAAYASLLLDGDEVLSYDYKVKPAEGGVLYVIDFISLHKLSINLS